MAVKSEYRQDSRMNEANSVGELDKERGTSAPGSTPLPVVGPGTRFLPVVQEACERAGMQGDQWHIRLSDDGPQGWVWAQHRGPAMPDQGWKLHISSTILSVLDVLERALPVLLVEDAAFKVAGSARMLVELNSGMSGLSQVGKFITVYPNSDEQAVRLAGALHRATQGLRGPVVPSDRPLMPGSLVHYRYGGFLHMYMQSGQGEAQLAVRAPSGEMVLDERNVAYQSPEWASDPFIAGNIAAPLPEANPLVGGRYLPISMLAISARGTVHAAVDIVGRRRCVLKRAYRDAAMGFDGTDAWDRLRNEAAVMAHLSPDPRFPEPYGVLEQDGDLFLAMEDVEGETLYNCVRALSVQGRYVSPRQAITWGLELAGMLGAIHAKGMAYRDLKSSNVIVSPGGGLRLVDFDVTMELTAPRPLYSPGTYGYMTREQRIDEPPRVAHDVYALGALLYFIATGAEPSMFPHHFDLLRRRVADVNPQVPAPLADVIARCLEPDPARRFASMADVHAALAAIESEGSEVTGKHISPGEAGREHYREMARRLGDTMCEAVLSGLLKQGRMWATAFGSENDAGLRDISVGSAGVVLALAELVDEIGDERHREVLAEMAQDLARTHPPQNRPMPGLYVGEAGVGAALLRAGQVLGRDDLITEAVAKGRLVSGLPHTSPALFNGTAGRLRYHLLLWDETGGEEHLAAAIEAGDILLRSAEPVGEEGGLRWTIPPGYNQHSGRTYLGYSLGAAGIGDALLDLFEATVDGRFLEGARGAGRWIARNVKAALEDGSGLDWPAVEGEELEGAFWGHGASGIGRFLIHAARLDALPGAHELARRAALTAAQGTRWAGPTLGYGLCGPIEFLLDMYQWNHEETYLRDAHALARVVESFAVEREGLLVWPSESPYLVTASFMAGYSGVAHTLLRLSAPERVPHHLGRRTYKGRLLGEGGAGALP